MPTWHDDLPSCSQLNDLLGEVLRGSQLQLPAQCTGCGGNTVHAYLHKRDEGLGGAWVWCGSCGATFHGSIRSPSWWRNLASIDASQLAAHPDRLNDVAAALDHHWNSLLHERRTVEMQTPIQFRSNTRPFTPTEPIRVKCRYVQQRGCPSHVAIVDLILEPTRGSDLTTYSWEVAEDVIPSTFAASVLQGVMMALSASDAPFDSIPGTRIRVVGGGFHPIDSSENDYVLATSVGVKEALQQAASGLSPA